MAYRKKIAIYIIFFLPPFRTISYRSFFIMSEKVKNVAKPFLCFSTFFFIS